ncbi:DUF4005 domain-containing protein [Citrus sinensis]|nr:protein IQ-DOMAIN 14 [Citrus x clementina]XP_006490343.1 protein IQ-DOMAIN 23 [Citrus sinensis]ESR35109.1 hypothetical protein CICLE_v10004956mg [Citrus x clementina]KAH9647211.1 DUF4005 domain-containing protein [Citrus sinensis]KAH9677968.1 DUF4005 domain-containing protein [Citrus sinensis]KDO60064.1 hypothetical protein CISIN_1g013059mg [Citrus sinensis]
MGFFRRLFGAKKAGTHSSSKEKRRWSFTSRSSSKQTTPSQSQSQPQSLPQATKPDASYEANLDANKHAIAVAAATAAVAEAALAAAHAAAEVVRLTSTGGRGAGVAAPPGAHVRWQHELAAVRIQCAFRGYLARRALKALKALVKLQALVRGHIVRKQTADMLKRMQTLVKVQARVRASRTPTSESLLSSSKSSLSRSTRCGSSSNFGDITDLDKGRLGSNWLDRWMEESVWNGHRVSQLKSGPPADDEKSDKILEVDTWKPHLNPRQHNRVIRSSPHGSALDYNNHSYMTIDSPSKLSVKNMNPIPSVSPGEVLSLSSLKVPVGKSDAALRTADNSPQVSSASYRPGSSARRGPFTPTRSEYSWGYFSGCIGHPNYMANTESSRAKVRSLSAPRQRLELERYGSTKRSAHGFWDGSINSERDFAQHADFRNRASPTSDRLSKFGSINLR